MESLFWQITNRTAETLLILNLFHLLLAGLALLVLLHHFRAARIAGAELRDRLLPLGFLLLVLHFSVLILHFGTVFFLRKGLALAGTERVSHGLLVAGVLVIATAYLKASGIPHTRWLVSGLPLLSGLMVLDLTFFSGAVAAGQRPHSIPMLCSDLLGLVAMVRAAWAVRHSDWKGRGVQVAALVSMGFVLFLHGGPSFTRGSMQIIIWNTEEHLLSLSLFAFAWAMGERSQNLLDRVFVRLNLTFIILASLIMLITAGMERFQYFRLAEERSMDLAEFLRGHIIYYRGQGQKLKEIFEHPEVLKRVIVEFGTLPELREVNVYLGTERASYRYTPNWEVKESFTPITGQESAPASGDLRNTFRMVRLSLAGTESLGDRVEFVGTTDVINQYIGKYIIVIYCSFTVVVALATGIIGIIVADTDRQLRRQYKDLQEAQQKLAQSAKLASIGELAGGMAHEINNPVTSILSLASHMAGEGSSTVSPRERKNMRLIVQQAQRIANLVGGLLSFSRQSQLQMSTVDVGELLETAISLVEYRMPDGIIRLQREVAPGLPQVVADASRLTEVFVNLLNNAIDSMPAGGVLTIRAAASPDAEGGVQVAVQDTGEGISPAHLPRIFDPFFTTKPPGRGTGLGLSISHGIVKDHGGEIWARSEPGAGTTLIVFLPQEAKRYEAAHLSH